MTIALLANHNSSAGFLSSPVTSRSFTTNSQAVSVGNFCLLSCATDNTALVAGVTATHTSMVDDASSLNIYQKIAEITETAGVAGDGVTLSLWSCVYVVALTTSNQITATFGSTHGFGFMHFIYSKTLPNISILGIASVHDAAADPSSLSISGLVSAEHAWIRATGHEGPGSDSYTVTAGWGSDHLGSTGHGDQDITIAQEQKIATSTTETSDPAFGGSATDHASILTVVKERSSAPAIYGGANHPVLTIDARIQVP